MNFNEYQIKAHETAIYPTRIKLEIVESNVTQENDMILERTINSGLEWIYPALGLAGESGELLNKLKKVIRDQNGRIHLVGSEYGEKIDILSLESELGDLLWYVSELATVLGLNLNLIADDNIKKLAERAKQNKIHGSGDKR